MDILVKVGHKGSNFDVVGFYIYDHHYTDAQRFFVQCCVKMAHESTSGFEKCEVRLFDIKHDHKQYTIYFDVVYHKNDKYASVLFHELLSNFEQDFVELITDGKNEFNGLKLYYYTQL